MKGKQVLTLIGVAIVLAGCNILRPPENPPLQWATPVAERTLAPVERESQITPTPTGPESSATPVPTERESGATQAVEGKEAQTAVCGGSGAYTILVLGLGSKEDDPPRAADAIRLVRADFEAGSLAILSLPHDLWVEVRRPGEQDPQWTVLYELFALGEAAQAEARPDPHAGARYFAEALGEATGVTSERYLVVDEPAFIALVDRLGGIEVELSEPLDGRAESSEIFPAGWQRLDGERALDFVRILGPRGAPGSGEAGRFQRQNQVLRALLEAVLRPENLGRITGLASIFRQAVVTNLSLPQVIELACLTKEAGGQAIVLEVGEESLVMDEEGRLFPNGEALWVLMERFAEGQ